MVSKLLKRNGDKFYFVFRVLIGLLFFLHGWMKVTGIMDGKIAFLSLMGLAAFVEVVGGIFIVVGFLTRPVAAICGIQMVFAYFMAHASGGLSPLANKGEPAVLFFVAFLVLAAHGAGRWGLDNE
ncbi:MAG: DoxX family protein [Nanoarchaeota archaeon]